MSNSTHTIYHSAWHQTFKWINNKTILLIAGVLLENLWSSWTPQFVWQNKVCRRRKQEHWPSKAPSKDFAWNSDICNDILSTKGKGRKIVLHMIWTSWCWNHLCFAFAIFPLSCNGWLHHQLMTWCTIMTWHSEQEMRVSRPSVLRL